MESNKPSKKYPVVGACGLDCGLCPRHHTAGVSRCPGCGGPGFFEKHPGCALTTCCVKNKGLEVCVQCPDFSTCAKASRLRASSQSEDSFISYRPVPANLEFIKKYGIEAFAQKAVEKEAFLRYLIDNFDDGRSRSFFCIACQLIPLEDLKKAVKNVPIGAGWDMKKKAGVMRVAISNLADSLKVDLKLRKK